MTTLQWTALLIPIAYVIGSIPTGLLVGLAKGIDPRRAGSGNIGATNLGRLLGARYFFLVFILDVIKGALPVALAGWILHDEPLNRMHYLLWLLVGFATLLGNLFSLFLKFRGGKGVATSTGLVLGLFPYFTLPGVLAAGVFGFVLKGWGYISLGSIAAAASFPLLYAGIGFWRRWDVLGAQLPLLIFAVVVAALVIWKHRSNIARLRAGTELRFKQPKP